MASGATRQKSDKIKPNSFLDNRMNGIGYFSHTLRINDNPAAIAISNPAELILSSPVYAFVAR
ncbi:hypothetical protein D1627_06785 [Pontibacter oryzae]|uniref:Uncharacterized protein n=1 Tax=Pontibacter oryzae TaxID=2304593 RepID=A0A399SFE2_9BACT|nr:hypothetical protein D1627_06785 [Pontibacter oryzae]